MLSDWHGKRVHKKWTANNVTTHSEEQSPKQNTKKEMIILTHFFFFLQTFEATHFKIHQLKFFLCCLRLSFYVTIESSCSAIARSPPLRHYLPKTFFVSHFLFHNENKSLQKYQKET